jgi:hypothetical protein
VFAVLEVCARSRPYNTASAGGFHRFVYRCSALEWEFLCFRWTSLTENSDSARGDRMDLPRPVPAIAVLDVESNAASNAARSVRAGLLPHQPRRFTRNASPGG